MAIALLALVFVIVISHARPEWGRWRRFAWFEDWLDRMHHWFGATAWGQSGLGYAFAIGLPVLLLGVLQWWLMGRWFGFFSVWLGIFVLFWCWGPRDLDLDVAAVQSAIDAKSRSEALQQLSDEPRDPPIPLEPGPMIDATFIAALQRWFSVCFWFLLLGPMGALWYRLVQYSDARHHARQNLSDAQRALATRLREALEWLPAHLMTMALALAADFDAVAGAWRDFHAARGRYFVREAGFLTAAARASVRIEEHEDEEEIGVTALPTLSRELGFAMALIWRVLIVWLLVFALMVLAGWIS